MSKLCRPAQTGGPGSTLFAFCLHLLMYFLTAKTNCSILGQICSYFRCPNFYKFLLLPTMPVCKEPKGSVFRVIYNGEFSDLRKMICRENLKFL